MTSPFDNSKENHQFWNGGGAGGGRSAPVALNPQLLKYFAKGRMRIIQALPGLLNTWRGIHLDLVGGILNLFCVQSLILKL